MTKQILAAAAALALSIPGYAGAVCGEFGDLDGDSDADSDDLAILQNFIISGGTDLTGYAWGDDIRCMELDCTSGIGAGDYNVLVDVSDDTFHLSGDSDLDGIPDKCECDYWTTLTSGYIPFGDINLSATVDVVDVQCAILVKLGSASAIGCYIFGANDSCIDYVSPAGIDDDDIDVQICLALHEDPEDCL